MSASEAVLYQLAEEGSIEELQDLLAEESFEKSALDEALHRAVVHCLSASDHIECIGVLINHDASPNHRDDHGVSMLMKAAKLGQIQLVQELLVRGADVKLRDSEMKTALHYALESDFGDNGDVVKMLLDKGSELNIRDHSGAMEVHKAAERGYLSSLTHILEAKGLVNAADEAGNTPLHLAAVNQHSECVTALLKHGAKVNIRNKEGLTVGSFAGAEVLSLLGSEAPDSGIAENGETVDKAAQTYGEYERAVETLSALDAEINTTRSSRVAAEQTLQDLRAEIARLKRERIQRRGEAEAKRSELVAGIEKAKKERASAEALAKARTPSLLFPSTTSQLYTHEELEAALERDLADLCTQVNAWQVSKKSSHEEVVAFWQSLVSCSIPGASVHVYGSYASLLHLPASDIDFVICDSPYPVVQTLEVLYERVGKIPTVHDQKLITTAVIPVLRLSLAKYDVKIDLTVQESTHRGLKCTEVCRSLLLKFPLLRNVFFALKFLLHYGEANEAFKGGLGSYGLLLMISSLLEKRRTYTCAASLIDFFKYYVHECDYLQPIAMEGEEQGTAFEEPVLFVPDPSHPQSNVARSANLEFLLHFLQVAEQKLWTRPFCGCAVGPLSQMVIETREWMCRS